MAELIRGLDARRVADNLARGARGDRRASDVEILAAVKYVAVEELGALAEAGVTLVGENRAQELEAKARRAPRASPGTSSATCRAARSSRSCRSCAGSTRSPATPRSSSSASTARRETEVLVEVNVAGEEGKSGVAPASSTPSWSAAR